MELRRNLHAFSVFLARRRSLLAFKFYSRYECEFVRYAALSLLAGLLSASFLNFASYYIAVFSFKFGLDPDNDTIPLITSLTDIFGVLCVLAAMKIVIG